jgi:hypothetical protein
MVIARDPMEYCAHCREPLGDALWGSAYGACCSEKCATALALARQGPAMTAPAPAPEAVAERPSLRDKIDNLISGHPVCIPMPALLSDRVYDLLQPALAAAVAAEREAIMAKLERDAAAIQQAVDRIPAEIKNDGGMRQCGAMVVRELRNQAAAIRSRAASPAPEAVRLTLSDIDRRIALENMASRAEFFRVNGYQQLAKEWEHMMHIAWRKAEDDFTAALRRAAALPADDATGR